MSVGSVGGATNGAQTSQSPGAGPTFVLDIPSGAITDPSVVALYASLAISDGQSTSAQAKVEDAEASRKVAIERARKALEAARAADDHGGFWSDLGDVAKKVATVAAVAGVAAAAGAGGPLAAAALVAVGSSALGFFMQQTGADGNVMNLGGVELRASDLVVLGGAAASMFVGGAGSTAGVSTLRRLCGGVAIGTEAVQFGALGTSAVAEERAGHYQKQSAELQADGKQERNRAEHERAAMMDAVELIRSSADARARALKAAQTMIETRNAALDAVVGKRA